MEDEPRDALRELVHEVIREFIDSGECRSIITEVVADVRG